MSVETKVKELTAQRVEVAVRISGDYCAFHEASIYVLYDYTNDKSIGYNTKEDVEELLEEGHDGDYSDTQMFSGVLVNGKYYVSL